MTVFPLRTELRRCSNMPRPVGFLQRFRNFLTTPHCRANFLFRCLEYATGAGAFGMSIDTLLVILMLTFGIGVVLHRWDLRRHL
jgi:hypothetical protein